MDLRHLRPFLAALVAMILAHCGHGCVPATNPNEEYNKAILWCVEASNTLRDSCLCRKAMDKQYGVCDGPRPHYGRCDYDCTVQPDVPVGNVDGGVR